MRKQFIVLVIVGFACLEEMSAGTGTGARGEGPAELGKKEEQSFEYVLMGLKASRDRLRSGVFRTYGLYTDLDKEEGDIRKPVEMYCAFDRMGDMIRFDRSLPARIRLRQELGKATGKLAQSKIVVRKTTVVITPREVLASERGSGALSVFSPHQKEVEHITGLPFDVRSLGLYYWIDFHRYARFESMLATLRNHKPAAIDRLSDGQWKIVWELSTPMHSQTSLWIDEGRGFTVTRSETRYGKKGSEKLLQWDEPKFVSAVTWELRDEVWVPKTYKLQNRRGEKLLSYDLAFNWESVNQPIAPRVFQKEGLDLTDRTLVVDRMSGKPIIEDVLNDNADHATYYGVKPHKASGSFWLWFTVLNCSVVAILVSLGYLWHRRQFKLRSTA